MIASTHLAVGAASALFVQRYVSTKDEYDVVKKYLFGFGAAIFSHMVLDSIYHLEYSLQGQALTSCLVVEFILVSMVLLFGQKNPVIQKMIVLGIIGGALPDGLYFVSLFTGWNWLLMVHDLLHVTHGMLSWLYANYFVQVLVTLLAVFYVRIKFRTA